MGRRYCQEARRLLEEESTGRLTPDERASLEIHLAACESCRAHQLAWKRIEHTARNAPLEPPSEDLVRRILSADPATTPPMRRARPGWHRAAAVAVVAVAAAVLLVLLPPDWPAWPSAVVEESALPSTPGVDAAVSPEGSVGEVADAVEASERLMMPATAPGTGLWLERGAVVRPIQNDPWLAQYQLERGAVVAEVGPNEPGFRFVVETPTALVTAWGTVFAVELLADGRERVRIAEGIVEVRSKHRQWEALVLPAGMEIIVGELSPREADAAAIAADLALIGRQPPPPAQATEEPAAPMASSAAAPHGVAEAPPVDAVDPAAQRREATRELLQRAREHQLALDFEAACGAYEELIRSYPDSGAVWTSHVALGQLELEPLDRPADALGHFEAYLTRHPAGMLAEEAWLGSIRALVRLERHGAVIESGARYLQQFPDGVAGPEVLWMRAEAHRSSGDPERATTDQRELIRRWPDAPHARLAAQALAAGDEAP